VAWVPARDLKLSEWCAVGRRFGAIGRCSQWWLGDWIRYGNAKFGERYMRAVAITGYDMQSLMNMVHVATRFEIYRRRENLSWSHHETVAALDPNEQDAWLQRAIVENLSVSDLRLALRSARRERRWAGVGARPTRGAPQSSVGSLPKAGVVICPRCGYEMPLRA
jgi:hypothetical protein